MGFRTGSDQSATSGASLPAVHASPRNWEVVRPHGSQRRSRPHMKPGTMTPWSSSTTSDFAVTGSVTAGTPLHRTGRSSATYALARAGEDDPAAGAEPRMTNQDMRQWYG
jgi:hypothetical protein